MFSVIANLEEPVSGYHQPRLIREVVKGLLSGLFVYGPLVDPVGEITVGVLSGSLGMTDYGVT